MYVLRYVVGSVILMLVGAIAGIIYYPHTHFTQHIGPILLWSSLLLIVAWAVMMFKGGEEFSEEWKNRSMWFLLALILIPTMFTAGAWLHQTQTSWSNGEIHWHADFEVVVQEDGEYRQLNLVDPGEFCRESERGGYLCHVNDRTGATEYHEHNDRRIHLEGVFREREDAVLSQFFETFNGKLTNKELVFPTNERAYELREGGNKTLKILVQKGPPKNRYWCAIGDDVPREDVCRSSDTDSPARSPDDYVMSPIQTGPIDIIWVVYDDETTEDALEDLRQDDRYKGMQVTKSGGGY